MSTLTKSTVEDTLKQVIDPNTGIDLITGKTVKKIEIDGDKLVVRIGLGYPADGYLATLKQAVSERLKQLDAAIDLDVET